jgi:hypothetical protein
LRLRKVRLLVAVLSLTTVWAALDASTAAASPKPVPIAIGHQNVFVRPAFDASRATSATIGSVGGTLSTITADGTTITLTLPRNALTGDEQLTMTPLVTLTGGGVQLVSGVQIGPDSLRLLEPATLDITPTHPVPKSQLVAFGYQGNGAQFGLVPLADRSSAEIPLIRLGGVGLARATNAQLTARVARPPSDIEAALLSQLAQPTYQLRRNRTVTADRKAIGGALAGYWTAYVKPTLGAPGSSMRAWLRAATRVAGWEEEVQTLGFAPRFRKDEKLVRTKVFQKALLKRWQALTGACGTGQTGLGNVQKALQLGRVAQIRGTSSTVGGSVAITAGIVGCGAMAAQATLNSTTSNWQSGQGSDYLSQIGAIVTAGPAPLVLQARAGNNEFSFFSAHVPIIERLTGWTLNATYPQCAKPTFAGLTTDPTQLFAAFEAALTVPSDLFIGTSAPPSGVEVAVLGSDLASWTTTCPEPVTFNQAPAAMAGLTAVTTQSPVHLTSASTTAKFQGSTDILAGPRVTGFANENGSITVTLPR